MLVGRICVHCFTPLEENKPTALEQFLLPLNIATISTLCSPQVWLAWLHILVFYFVKYTHLQTQSARTFAAQKRAEKKNAGIIK